MQHSPPPAAVVTVRPSPGHLVLVAEAALFAAAAASWGLAGRLAGGGGASPEVLQGMKEGGREPGTCQLDPIRGHLTPSQGTRAPVSAH
jgi:hypothetical protein